MRDKPILLLYISDLDVNGWDMPTSFQNAINEIYPREEHTMVRVALTREQVTEYHLPEAFDISDKNQTETQKLNFVKETGGEKCVELDALDESLLLKILEEKLEANAGLEEDNDEYQLAEEQAEDNDVTSVSMNLALKNFIQNTTH